MLMLFLNVCVFCEIKFMFFLELFVIGLFFFLDVVFVILLFLVFIDFSFFIIECFFLDWFLFLFYVKIEGIVLFLSCFLLNKDLGSFLL